MTLHHRPIARQDRPPDRAALPLAGLAHLWFDTVHVAGAPIPADGLPGAVTARLSAARPALMGLDFDSPRIMGILNTTPDSFSDGGLWFDRAAALTQARAMAAAGADILDIGGESTRPGAAEVSVAEEIRRTVPVIEALRDGGLTTPISIDTRKAVVARAALAAGADMINDVSALGFDPDMAGVVADAGVPVCLMHAKGDPRTMQDDPRYDDVLAEVIDMLASRVAAAQDAGIAQGRIMVDPGIGFGKTLAHNVTLLQGLAAFHDLGCHLLLGASRKRFIGMIGGGENGPARMPGSVAVALFGAAQGAHVLRVHDVAETVQALRLWLALSGRDTEESMG